MKKKFFCMPLVIALIVGQVYAIGFSIGISAPGIGVSVLRGEDAENLLNTVEKLNFEEDSKISFYPAVQVDFLFEFSPYLGLEIGIGYGRSVLSWTKKIGPITDKIELKREAIIIPVMGRGQFALGIFNIYVALGPKFVIPVAHEYFTHTLTAGNVIPIDAVIDNRFTIDLGFALGVEIKIDKLYLGVRAGYDLNLISPIKENEDTGEKVQWYHDTFNASITLRHML